jgi:cytochrome oxidase Cu insertion factor (SCO1/SenC/PrrC family)
VVRDQYHVAYWKVAGAEESAEQGNALAERAHVGYDIKHSDVTYVIDGNGTIRHLFTGKNAATTATLLNAIRRAHAG